MKELPKDFFEWVLDIMGFYNVKIDDDFVKGLKNVNRYTRAGKSGKVIYCPNCNAPETVYNFSWALATCPSCDTTSYKHEWLVK
tara:strand:+ start:237 stop:488 length:252 start_codon:yes stop_codon:yes gene_type:complete